jgi:hypothetical protein
LKDFREKKSATELADRKLTSRYKKKTFFYSPKK